MQQKFFFLVIIEHIVLFMYANDDCKILLPRNETGMLEFSINKNDIFTIKRAVIKA